MILSKCLYSSKGKVIFCAIKPHNKVLKSLPILTSLQHIGFQMSFYNTLIKFSIANRNNLA